MTQDLRLTYLTTRPNVRFGGQPRFQSCGPIPWSRVLLPFYRKIRQVYPVWCSRLHNHTLFIKKLCKKLGSVQILGRSGPPYGPQWLRPWSRCFLAGISSGFDDFALVLRVRFDNNIQLGCQSVKFQIQKFISPWRPNFRRAPCLPLVTPLNLLVQLYDSLSISTSAFKQNICIRKWFDSSISLHSLTSLRAEWQYSRQRWNRHFTSINADVFG